MEIYLVRHTSVETAVNLCYGRMDVPLADTWKREFNEVKRNLPKGLERVYSSPSERCTKLAFEISESAKIQKALQDLDYGDWEGLFWDEIPKKDFETWSTDFLKTAPPNGESVLEMFLRATDFLDELRKENSSKVALITHTGVIRSILCYLLEIPLKNFYKINVAYGRVLRLELSGEGTIPQITL